MNKKAIALQLNDLSTGLNAPPTWMSTLAKTYAAQKESKASGTSVLKGKTA